MSRARIVLALVALASGIAVVLVAAREGTESTLDTSRRRVGWAFVASGLWSRGHADRRTRSVESWFSPASCGWEASSAWGQTSRFSTRSGISCTPASGSPSRMCCSRFRAGAWIAHSAAGSLRSRACSRCGWGGSSLAETRAGTPGDHGESWRRARARACRDWARRRSRRAGHRGSSRGGGGEQAHGSASRSRPCCGRGQQDSSSSVLLMLVDDSLRNPLSHLRMGLHDLALAGVAVGFLVGLLRARLARSAVAELVVELGETTAPGDLRDALARALGIRRSRWPTGSRTAVVTSTSTADRSTCRPKASRGRCRWPSGTVAGSRRSSTTPRSSTSRSSCSRLRGGRTGARERATPSRAQGTALESKEQEGAAASADRLVAARARGVRPDRRYGCGTRRPRASSAGRARCSAGRSTLAPPKRARARAVREGSRGGVVERLRDRAQRKDGTLVHVSSGAPISDESGPVQATWSPHRHHGTEGAGGGGPAHAGSTPGSRSCELHGPDRGSGGRGAASDRAESPRRHAAAAGVDLDGARPGRGEARERPGSRRRRLRRGAARAFGCARGTPRAESRDSSGDPHRAGTRRRTRRAHPPSHRARRARRPNQRTPRAGRGGGLLRRLRSARQRREVRACDEHPRARASRGRQGRGRGGRRWNRRRGRGSRIGPARPDRSGRSPRGRLWLSSPPGQGTIVRAEIPCA